MTYKSRNNAENAKEVLVVEDDPVIREVLSETLAIGNYDISRAADGKKALAGIRRNPPFAVILDLGLPGLDGMEVCRFVKKEFPDVRIIIVTARDDARDREEGLRAGADCYLAKPFSPLELLESLE